MLKSHELLILAQEVRQQKEDEEKRGHNAEMLNKCVKATCRIFLFGHFRQLLRALTTMLLLGLLCVITMNFSVYERAVCVLHIRIT